MLFDFSVMAGTRMKSISETFRTPAVCLKKPFVLKQHLRKNVRPKDMTYLGTRCVLGFLNIKFMRRTD